MRSDTHKNPDFDNRSTPDFERLSNQDLHKLFLLESNRFICMLQNQNADELHDIKKRVKQIMDALDKRNNAQA